MKWIIFALVMVIAILTVICYALMVMAHDADERAEKMYKEWKHERSDRRLKSDHIKVKGAEYVRDLVRCRDCKYLEVHGKTTMYYWCDQWEHYTDEDSFCANSEVRDEQ